MASRSRKKWEKPKTADAVEVAPEPAVAAEPASPAPPEFWQRHGRWLLLLWVCSLVPYINSFRDGFPFDNALAITFDSRVHAATAANLHTILTTEYWYGTASSGLYRPLTTLSYLLNYAVLGGGNLPAGYHVFNSILQVLNVSAVYLLGFAIFESAAPALAMGVLWSVHPLLTESVTNIVGRADQLAAFAALAGLLLHIAAGKASGLRKLGWLGGMAAVIALGMFSKESAIVVLAMMLLYDLAFPDAARWRARIWGYVAAVIPIAIYFQVRASVFAQSSPGQFPLVDNPLVGADFLVSRLTAVKVLGKYLWMYLWPLRLSADYSYNQIPVAVDWKAILSLAVCCALAVAALIGALRSERVPYKAMFFFIGVFFATMAPTSNIFLLIGTIMAERFMYLPSVGLAGLLVLAIFAACRRIAPAHSQTAAAAVVAVLSLAFAARTFARNIDWYDDRSLTSASVKGAPDSFKTHLGMAHDTLALPKPDFDVAIAEAERSIAILAPLSDADSTCRPFQAAGEAWRRKGDSLHEDQARQECYRKALAVLLRGKQIDQLAKRQIELIDMAKGLRLMAMGWEALYLELGRVYERLGDPGKAIEELRYGLAIKPNAEFYEEIARIFRLTGDNRQAEITLMEGLVVDPTATVFAAQLVDLYAKSDPQSCAVQHGPTGASLNLGCPLVHEELCLGARNVAHMQFDTGRRKESTETFQTAVGAMGCPAQVFR